MKRSSYSPPDAGGVRGGMGEGKNLKKKLICLTYTPPHLPYARGGIKRVSPGIISFLFKILLLRIQRQRESKHCSLAHF